MNKRLFVSVDFPPEIGGIQNYLYGLISNLDSSSNLLLTSSRLNTEDIKDFDSNQSFNIQRMRLDNSINIIQQVGQIIRLLKRIRKLITEENVNQIHFGNVLPVGIAGLFLNKKIKVYSYAYGLDILEAQKSKLKLKILKKVLKRSHKVITISEYTKQLLMNLGVSENKIIIINPGFELPKSTQDEHYNLKDKYKEIQNNKIILTVARLQERKGHDKVIEALNQIIKHQKNVVYAICGTGPNRGKLESLVKKYNLQKHVIFTGEVDNNELLAWYNQCDVFVMASRQLKDKGDVEGYGIVFLEANYYGKPVIGGNSGGIPDAIKDGETGFLVNPNSTTDISKKLLLLLKNEQLASELGFKGKLWVENECLWKYRVRNFEKY